MIPLKLTLEGLYSYQTKQIIDFANLTAAGLFGIFGATGSGKSAILEAISYALYGETERLHNRDNRAYNMMNLKSNRSVIDFEFLNHDDKVYRVRREFSRNSKNFDDVKVKSVVYYAFENDAWIPLDEFKSAESILNLSYKNFKRTIIIPQGQFQEFLTLSPSERTQMMKEIFNLDAYDLFNKVSDLQSINNSNIDRLDGELSVYEDIIEEIIEQLKAQERELKGKVDVLKKMYEQQNTEFTRVSQLFEESKLLQGNLVTLTDLEGKKADFDLRESQVNLYESLYKDFAQLFSQEQSEIEAVKDSNKALTNFLHDLATCKREIETIRLEIKELIPEFEKIDDNKKLIHDLTTLVKLKEEHQSLAEAESRLEKGKDVITEKTKEQTELGKAIEALNNNIAQKKKEVIGSSILIALSGWYQQAKFNKEQLLSKSVDLEKIEDAISKNAIDFATLGLSAEDYEAVLKAEWEILYQEENRLSALQSQLALDKKLSAFKETLHEGEPCPLCGSNEHPHIISLDDLTEAFAQYESDKSKYDNKITQYKKKEESAKQLKFDLANFQKQKDEIIAKNRELMLKQQEHLATFIWHDFDAKDAAGFEAKKASSNATEQQIADLEIELQKTQDKLNRATEDLNKYNLGFQKIEKDIALLNGSINSKLDTLQQVVWTDYLAVDIDVIQAQKAAKENEIKTVELNYTLAEKKLNELSNREAGLTASVQATQSSLKSTETKLNVLKQNIEKALAEYPLLDRAMISNILSKTLDVKAERNEIERFKIALTTQLNKVTEQKDKLKDFSLDQTEFDHLKADLDLKKQEFEQEKEQLILLTGNLNSKTKAFAEKQNKLKEKEVLDKRAENLKQLRNLFSGSGFVKYVSSIFLAQLCNFANIRFGRMTRNQLILTINDNFDFEVIDNLNEGRRRSVKTLSGGQIFQVSLALALALAESVQVKSKAKQHFFFIDEGFGTQDSEAVNMVYETLQNLNKENKVVGIISHVDELKERIPMSLSVVKDADQGSLLVLN